MFQLHLLRPGGLQFRPGGLQLRLLHPGGLQFCPGGLWLRLLRPGGFSCSPWWASSALVGFGFVCSALVGFSFVCSALVGFSSALVGFGFVCSALVGFSFICSALVGFGFICSTLAGFLLYFPPWIAIAWTGHSIPPGSSYAPPLERLEAVLRGGVRVTVTSWTALHFPASLWPLTCTPSLSLTPDLCQGTSTPVTTNHAPYITALNPDTHCLVSRLQALHLSCHLPTGFLKPCGCLPPVDATEGKDKDD